MNDISRYSNSVWDLLFEVIQPGCEESMSTSEIEASLKSAGIDLDAAFSQMKKLIEAHKAKGKMSAAQQTRKSLADKLGSVVAPHVDRLRAGVQSLIGNATCGPEQLAYFHKLEGAATEQDLQSLMDDLQKLAALRELSSSDDTKAQ